MIGQMIGEYRILDKRGEGGMGVFYKAVDSRLERIVGIKTLRAELLADPELAERLQFEARALAHLDHRNIARLLHYLVIEDQHFIVMEYVEGLDLSEKVKSEGLLSLALLAEITPQICSALTYAHECDVIHRDVKPSNILVTADNIVKVTDFGIAKIVGVSAKTRTGIATGSLPFMAPEQIRNEEIDARTDVYQLGVTLFELVTGQRPFKADNEYEMMSQHLNDAPPTASSINSRSNPAIDEVLNTALAKAPADRYQSAEDLGKAFAAAVKGEADAPTRYEQVAMPSPATRKRPVRAVFAILAAVTIIAAAIIGWKMWNVEPTWTQVEISAQYPDWLPEEAFGEAELWVDHPEGKTHWRASATDLLDDQGNRLDGSVQSRDLATDSIDFTTRRAIRIVEVRPAEEIIFRAQLRDSSNIEFITTGKIFVDIPDVGTVIKVAFPHPLRENEYIRRRYLAQQEEVPPASVPPAVEDTITTVAVTDDPEPPAEPDHNLVIDILPFSARRTIEKLWLDGQEVQPDGRLIPARVESAPGLHILRWRIGGNLWTDTVNVGRSGIREKHLFAEPGAGRLNIAGGFGGAAGFANILIDGQTTDQGTPYEFRNIAAGPHQVTLVRAGYKMVGGPYIVVVRADDRTRIQIEMTTD